MYQISEGTKNELRKKIRTRVIERTWKKGNKAWSFFNWVLKLSVKAVNVIAFGVISVSWRNLFWQGILTPCCEEAEEN